MAPSLILLVTYQTISVPILVLLSKSAQFVQKWQLIRSTIRLIMQATNLSKSGIIFQNSLSFKYSSNSVIVYNIYTNYYIFNFKHSETLVYSEQFHCVWSRIYLLYFLKYWALCCSTTPHFRIYSNYYIYIYCIIYIVQCTVYTVQCTVYTHTNKVLVNSNSITALG